jgi:hypothetical protein
MRIPAPDLEIAEDLKQESIDALAQARKDERFGLTMYTMRYVDDEDNRYLLPYRTQLCEAMSMCYLVSIEYIPLVVSVGWKVDGIETVRFGQPAIHFDLTYNHRAIPDATFKAKLIGGPQWQKFYDENKIEIDKAYKEVVDATSNEK